MPRTANPFKKWALFVYMCADMPQPGLRRAAHANLLQMASIGSSDDVWVAAQLACPGPWTYRYIFPDRPPGSPVTVIKPFHTIPSVDSASVGSITEFFGWASEACPATNIMLVLWGHGYGTDYYSPWLPSNSEFLTPVPPFPANDEGNIAVDLQTSNKLFLSAMTQWRFGPSELSGKVLDNYQIGDALRICTASLSSQQELAILGFDACLMAMAEVWCEMEETASIGIASQAGLPFLGWPYDRFLSSLLQQPTATPPQVAQMLLDAFTDFYAMHPTQYVTLSACDLSRIGQLEQAIHPLAQALTEASADPEAAQSIFTAWDYCPAYGNEGFIDFGCLCAFLQITMPNTAVSAACGPALQAIRDFVVGSAYSPPNRNKKIAQSMGISVWMPAWIQNPYAGSYQRTRAETYLANPSGYAMTEFAQNTGWDKFLTSYKDHAWHAAGRRADRTALSSVRLAKERKLHIGEDAMSDEQFESGNKGPDRQGPDRQGPDRQGPDRQGTGGKNAQRVFSAVSPGAAGIVLRATVESFGPAGEAELHFTVKWPASGLGATTEGLAVSTQPPASLSAPALTDSHPVPHGGLTAPATLPHAPLHQPSAPGPQSPASQAPVIPPVEPPPEAPNKLSK